MADPKTASQLVSGFYDVEANAWRWTARRFVVSFPPPANGEEKGGKLELRLFIPDTQIKALGPLTLTVEVNEKRLEPETFSKEGQYTYTRDVPASALHSNLIPVLFSFDKALHAGSIEGRELGAVVSMAALLPR